MTPLLAEVALVALAAEVAGDVAVAKRTGLILPLGEWVLHEVTRMAVRLQARGGKPLTVAVNLSARQPSDRGLVATVRADLNAHRCGADRLVLETTETARVTDLATAIDSLHELRELGAGVALDDFGTGYSSVLYLKQANDKRRKSASPAGPPAGAGLAVPIDPSELKSRRRTSYGALLGVDRTRRTARRPRRPRS